MAMVILFILSFLLPSGSWAARSLDTADYQASEKCALIAKTIKLQPAAKINKDDPALSQCSQARMKDVCQQAKQSLDKTQANKGKMPACKGVQVAEATVIRIDIIHPVTGQKTFYDSVGASPSAARMNADANFDYLKSHGFKPTWNLNN